jgi:hypothetical protein
MGGGLMQLVAYGAQDIYLTGNPQITFFKVVYRRHTNFSMEAIQQTFNGTADFGGSVSATISRNGDLVHRMYLEHDLATNANQESSMVANYGSRLMKECELEIGGQKIDKHYGHWHSVYSQLTEFNPSGSPGILYNKMTGNGLGANTASAGTGSNSVSAPSWDSTTSGTQISGKIWIPLLFWFCRNPGLALPLIALQYHEVKVRMVFEDYNRLIIGEANDVFGDSVGQTPTTAATKTFNLWCDYIYLDTDERRRFAQVSHEYLIEQLQFSSYSGTQAGAASLKLNFNHPVKELIWTGGISNLLPVGMSVGLARGGGKITLMKGTHPAYFTEQKISGDWQLKLNGHDRFKGRDFKYFTRTQIWEHHTGYGAVNNPDSIAVYSFALKPEEHQPSGTCNFSRIDNAQLTGYYSASANANGSGGTSDLPDQDGGLVFVYAINYNVLRIMSGMGGLAYSN